MHSHDLDANILLLAEALQTVNMGPFATNFW